MAAKKAEPSGKLSDACQVFTLGPTRLTAVKGARQNGTVYAFSGKFADPTQKNQVRNETVLLNSDLFGPDGQPDQLAPALEKAGLKPADFTCVWLDRFGGQDFFAKAVPEGKSPFANAQFAFPASNFGSESPDFKKARVALNNQNRLMYYQGSAPGYSYVKFRDLAPASALPLPYIEVEPGTVLAFLGENVTDPAQLANPDAGDPKLARERRDNLQWLAENGHVTAAAHLPFPGLGKVVADGKGFAFTPISQDGLDQRRAVLEPILAREARKKAVIPTLQITINNGSGREIYLQPDREYAVPEQAVSIDGKPAAGVFKLEAGKKAVVACPWGKVGGPAMAGLYIADQEKYADGAGGFYQLGFGMNANAVLDIVYSPAYHGPSLNFHAKDQALDHLTIECGFTRSTIIRPAGAAAAVPVTYDLGDNLSLTALPNARETPIARLDEFLGKGAENAETLLLQSERQSTAFLVRDGQDLHLFGATLTSPQFCPDLLVPALEKAGVKPADLTKVYMGGFQPEYLAMMRPAGKLFFPNATYHFNYSSLLNDEQDSDKVQAYLERLKEITGGKINVDRDWGLIHADDTLGPNRANSLYSLGLKGIRMVLLGVLIRFHPLQLSYPDVTLKSDGAPVTGYPKSARQALEEIVRNGDLVAGMHFPFPGIGKLEKDGDGFKFVAMPAAAVKAAITAKQGKAATEKKAAASAAAHRGSLKIVDPTVTLVNASAKEISIEHDPNWDDQVLLIGGKHHKAPVKVAPGKSVKFGLKGETGVDGAGMGVNLNLPDFVAFEVFVNGKDLLDVKDPTDGDLDKRLKASEQSLNAMTLTVTD